MVAKLQPKAVMTLRQKIVHEAEELGWSYHRAPQVDTFERDGEQLLVSWSVDEPDAAVSATRIRGADVTRVADGSAAVSVRCWLGSPWV